MIEKVQYRPIEVTEHLQDLFKLFGIRPSRCVLAFLRWQGFGVKRRVFLRARLAFGRWGVQVQRCFEWSRNKWEFMLAGVIVEVA